MSGNKPMVQGIPVEIVDAHIVAAYKDRVNYPYPVKMVAEKLGIDATRVRNRVVALSKNGVITLRKKVIDKPHKWTMGEEELLQETIKEFSEEPYLAFYELTGIRPVCAYAHLNTLARKGQAVAGPPMTNHEYAVSDQIAEKRAKTKANIAPESDEIESIWEEKPEKVEKPIKDNKEPQKGSQTPLKGNTEVKPISKPSPKIQPASEVEYITNPNKEARYLLEQISRSIYQLESKGYEIAMAVKPIRQALDESYDNVLGMVDAYLGQG